MSCPVCDGKGFVQAAPLSAAPMASPWGRGAPRPIVGRNHRRVALWSKAVTIPCWLCCGGAA